MKKIFSAIVLFAAAATAFISCNKENFVENTPITFSISASSDITKSCFGEKSEGKYPTKWTANQQVSFSRDEGDLAYATPVPSSDSTSASFTVTLDGTEESGTIYAFSPKGVYDAKVAANNRPGFTSINNTSHFAYLNIPSEQTPLANSVDEAAHAMYASASYENGNTCVNMTFNHVVAYGKMTITGFTSTIASVKLTFPENIAGGSCKYYYASNTINNTATNTITLDPANVVNNTFWFALAPTAGNTGKMTVTITDINNDTFTKSVDLSAKAMPFKTGHVSLFTVNFSGITKDENAVSLPWNWDGGGKSGFLGIMGVSASGLGDDYAEMNAPYQIKLDNTGDYFIIHTDSAIKDISIGVKMIGGNASSSLTVEGSSDGSSYSSVEVLSISGEKDSILNLVTSNEFELSYRFVKVTFTKGNNVGIGPISITKQSGTPTCKTPVISYNAPTVTITCATSGAAIHYTLDGTTPTGESALYSTPFDIESSATVKAIAIKADYNNSEIASQNCEISAFYSISISNAIENGSVSASQYSAIKGTEITLTPTPNEGYIFKSWDVKDTNSNPITVSDNKFTMPASNVTVSATFAKGSKTYSFNFTSKAWADANNGWTSNKDAYQYSKPNIQITSAYSGAGATTKSIYKNITKITISASTTSKGAGNITVKVGDGAAQTVCSLSKTTTAQNYSIEYATPVTGKVTLVVNCSTNSMYVQSAEIAAD